MTPATGSPSFDAVGKLLRTTLDIADATMDLAERRRATLEYIALNTNSDFAHWSWSRARAESGGKPLVVGSISWGFTDKQLAEFWRFSLDGQVQDYLNRELQSYLQCHPRSDGGFRVIASEAIRGFAPGSDHPIMKASLGCGIADWLQGCQFFPGGIQCLFTFGRSPDKPPFTQVDCDLMDLAFSNISWLRVNPDEQIPQENVEALTARQRAVTFHLLDGLSRKQIAKRLGISEETVDSHLRVVFKHFGVQTAMELAALFLRKQ